MRLNTRGRYGIQLMAQLACQSTEAGALGLKHVSAATGLPWRYLEQIARPLRQAGLVRGRAGRTGGYVLARQPEQITLRDVLEATSGPLCLMDCVDDPSACERTASCTSRQVWLAVTEDIRQVLARYTLCDLAKRPCSGCREAAETAREHRTERATTPKKPKAPARRARTTRS
jgi:Rrf2 family protein